MDTRVISERKSLGLLGIGVCYIMSVGDLVWYEDIDGGLAGLVMYLDTNRSNEVCWVVRWSDGTITHEPESEVDEGIIKVIQ